MTKFAGLPAHPLLVHIPVVLLPLAAIGAIAMALSGWVRDRLGWVVLAVAVVAGASTQLAVDSGQALQDSVSRSSALDQHIAIGESIRPLALVLFLVALAVMLLDRRGRGRWPFPLSRVASSPPPKPPPTWLRAGLIALTVVIAGATTARLYQIGHTGAQATWERTTIVARSGDDR